MTEYSAAPSGNSPKDDAEGAPGLQPGASSAAPWLFGSGDLVRAAHEAILTVDEQQRIVMLNPAAQHMFGCSAEDALGSHLSRFIPHRHREEHASHVRGFAVSGATQRTMGHTRQVHGLRASGEEFPAEVTISRLAAIGATGNQHYYSALVCDLSEVRQLQAEIEAINTRIRAIFELVPVAMWITEDDTVVFANRACLALFAATNRGDVVGRPLTALLGPDSHRLVHGAVNQALATNTPVPAVKEQIACMDGTLRDVEIAVAPLPDHGRTALQMVITDITRQYQENREAEQSRQELRQLSANLVQAREEERRRIARELHDELGQRLSTLHMELSSLPGDQAGLTMPANVSTMLAMVDETVASVRRIATELRPLMLDDLGLKAAIEWLVMDWARRKGIPVELDLWETDPPLTDNCTIALYRMVQEALTNIVRHAQASRASVRLHQENGEVVLTVQDDGVGFPVPSLKRKGSHGLLGIRERASMLGGQMEAGKGTLGGARISIRLPLAPLIDQDAPFPALGNAP